MQCDILWNRNFTKQSSDWIVLLLQYLFSEVFGHPGFVISCSLPLLPSLTLLQSVFVLRGLVDVPFLQRLCHVLPQPPISQNTFKTVSEGKWVWNAPKTLTELSPGFCPRLFLHRPQLLLGDGKFGRVDHFGFSAAVRELQRAVPLSLCFAHDGVRRVVLDLCCHPMAARQRPLLLLS